MPKELTHWMIARAVARRLAPAAAPQTSQSVSASPEAFLLGAIAHDVPFYLPREADMTSRAAKLHGRGVADAYAPIKRAIAGTRAGSEAASSAVAFAAGALCHMAADVVFHPAIFFFTGFAGHPNGAVSGAYLFRHRAFESAMDLHFLAQSGGGIERTVAGLYRRAVARPDAAEWLAAAARFYGAVPSPLAEVDVARVFHGAARRQRLFFSPTVRLVAGLFGLASATQNDDASSLFYRRSSEWNAYFSSPRPYQDPISGADGVFEVRPCFERAVDSALSLLPTLERALGGDAAAFPFPGPCLESGHPVNADQRMRYCDPVLEHR
jgi:hypothetical protein